MADNKRADNERADYERELAVTIEAARAAGTALLRHYEDGTETWEKSKDNPVTAADLEADRIIAEHLRAAFPEDAILSEETVSTLDRLRNPRVWIVDPMDGTKEFTKRIPEFAVSIALTHEGQPVVGVIHNPLAGVTVWASQDGGAFRDGDRVRVSGCQELSESVVVASRSEIGRGEFEPYEGWFKQIEPMGSIAWKLAVVASGSADPADADLNISVAPKNEWDVCAGDLLIREAGGRYVDFDGNPRVYNQEKTLIDCYMAAGSAALLDQFFARDRERTAG
jgi:myo-inositol-1(or 4)-monophosphatase